MPVVHRPVPPSRGRSLARLLVGGGVLVAAGALGAAPAGAHVSPNVKEVPAGGFAEVYLGVGHGCDGSPTTKIEVQVPEALTDVTPIVVPGWTGSVTTEKLDPPVTAEDGDDITERDAVVTWTADPGNALPDHWKRSFGLSFQVPDAVGDTLEFKTIQTCEQGSTEWVEETPAGGEEPEHPAPTVMIVEGTGGDAHGGGATTTTAAGGGSDEPASNGTAESGDGDSSDSSKGLAIAGLVAGLGGLGLGGASFARSRKG